MQLAGYQRQQNVQSDSDWTLLRNSQTNALELPHTGMTVAIDLGNPTEVHPTKKQEVARRLSLLTLHNDYNRADLVCEAPTLSSSKVEGNKLVLRFNGK